MEIKQAIQSFFETIQNSSILQGIGWLIGVGGFVWGAIQLLRSKIKLKWAQYDNRIYSKEFLLKQAELFIPNHYKMPSDPRVFKPDMGSFIDLFLFTEKDQFVFLEAGTGVGKTTYLANLFITYKNKFRWWQKLFRTKPNILLLNYNSLCRDVYADDEFKGLLSRYKKNAENTILLIDAIDEFQVSSKDPTGTFEFSKYYTKEFIETWKKVLSTISSFRKVVFTVRSQFLTAEIKSALNFGKYIELMPFTDWQALDYLRKKKALSPSKKENFTFVWYKLEGVDNYIDEQYYEVKLSRLPLILNYIELIVDDYETLDRLSQTKALNIISILELIVKNWVKREIEDDHKRQGKNYGEMEELALFEFCKELACKIALNRGFDSNISQKEYEELLQHKKVSTLKFDDRSLLKKTEQKGVSAWKLQDIDEQFYYGFVHKMFFEYFLGEYAEKMEKAGLDSGLDFSNHTLAQEIFTRKRWEDLKAFRPDIAPNIIDSYNYLPYEELKKWHSFFMGFAKNDSLKQAIVQKGLGWIERYDTQGYKERFESLKGLAIFNKPHGEGTSNNFWDYNKKQPYPEIQELIPFIKDFIVFIYLRSIPELDEIGHLRCFDGVKKILGLILSASGLTGECFQYFANSAETLIALVLENNQISNDIETLKVFRGSKLIFLNLNNNQITGEGLQYFASSAETLEELRLANNQISNDIETLKVFKDVRLTILDLSNNQITGDGLQYFTNSAETLKELSLDDNKIANDIETLKAFRGAKLNHLNLNYNQITGEGLQYFVSSTETLEELRLANNQISNDIETLKVFKDAKLTILDLGNNQITGDGLQYFANSAETLESLGLYNNQLSNDIETLKAFKGTKQLKVLQLGYNQITGDGLQYFAKNINSLMFLGLSGTSIGDKDLEIFKGIPNLQILTLRKMNITGESLSYFSNSSDTLEELYLTDNSLLPENVLILEIFNHLKKLTIDRGILPDNHFVYENLKKRNVNIEFNERD